MQLCRLPVQVVLVVHLKVEVDVGIAIAEPCNILDTEARKIGMNQQFTL